MKNYLKLVTMGVAKSVTLDDTKKLFIDKKHLTLSL